MTFKKVLQTSFAVAGVAAAFVAIPGSASAAFDASHATQCANAGSIAGVGASFQRDAQLAWGATLLAPNPGGPNATGFGYFSTANGGCSAFQLPAAGGTKTITYEPKGSGDGRNAFGASTVAGVAGVRNTNYAFGGADEPPTTAQLTEANNGPDHTAGTSDDAVLRTIPVAQSSVAIDVKLPAGCTVAATPAARKISRTALAGVFAGTTTTWGAVLPTGGLSSTCAALPVQRVVRLDSSGTTAAFKNYLRAIDPTTFPTSLGNTAWPNDSGSTAVVRGAANGAGPLLDALSGLTTGGGIGYADLATSRDKTYDWGTGTDDQFWLYVERQDGTFTSPALNNNAGTTTTGSNCVNATYKDNNGTTALPTSTEVSWANVSAVATTADYALCALTYSLAWVQPSQANVGVPAGQPLITQDQARTVRDYLGFAVKATGGQSQLAGAGYQALPSAVQAIAKVGVEGGVSGGTTFAQLNW